MIETNFTVSRVILQRMSSPVDLQRFTNSQSRGIMNMHCLLITMLLWGSWELKKKLRSRVSIYRTVYNATLLSVKDEMLNLSNSKEHLVTDRNIDGVSVAIITRSCSSGQCELCTSRQLTTISLLLQPFFAHFFDAVQCALSSVVRLLCAVVVTYSGDAQLCCYLDDRFAVCNVVFDRSVQLHSAILFD